MKLQAVGNKIVVNTGKAIDKVRGERRENVGVVESIGDDVTFVKVGQKIMFEGALAATLDGYITDESNVMAILYE